jgi:hypothetical protein
MDAKVREITNNKMKLKYILTKSGAFVIFHPVTAHNDMARGLYGEPISAGFCYIDITTPKPEEYKAPTLSIRCFGESISMKLKSRPEDSEIITKALNNPYE